MRRICNTILFILPAIALCVPFVIFFCVDQITFGLAEPATLLYACIRLVFYVIFYAIFAMIVYFTLLLIYEVDVLISDFDWNPVTKDE